jgi:hypothetical protein
MRPTFASLLLACIAPSAPALAGPAPGAAPSAEPLVLKGSVRSRLEAIGGQFRPRAPESDFLFSLRSSLFAEYDAGPLRIGGELIDVRGYGQAPGSSAGTGEVNALELVQAYARADFGDALGGGSDAALTAGRFMMQVGAGRLVAIQSFRNTANGFTGARFDWSGAGGDRLLAFWTMPQIRLPSDPAAIRRNRVEWDAETSDLQLFGASFAKSGLFGKGSLEPYVLRLQERDSIGRPTRNRRLTTIGGRAYRSPGKGPFDFDVETAYQFGSARATASAADTADLDVGAWFAHAEVGRKFGGRWSPRLSVHFDLASGDGPDPRRYGRFDSLYGSARKDLGPSGLYNLLGRANLVSPGLRLDARPSGRLDGFVMYRAAWLEEAGDSFALTGVRDRTGRSGRFAGHQVEGAVRYWLVPDRLRAELGGAWFGKGRFLRDAPNAPATGDTRYVFFDLAAEF